MKEKLINYFEDLKTSKHANKLFFGAALFCLKNNMITEDEYDELKKYYTYLYESEFMEN